MLDIASWLLVMSVVGVCQYAAASLWEKLLWKEQRQGWDTYLSIGVLWGGLGVSLFNLKAVAYLDPSLMAWMAQSRLLVVYLVVAVGVAAYIAWSTVNKNSHSFWIRLFNSATVAAFMTFSYPTLKWLEQGVWILYSDHILAFALYMVTFSAIVAMTTLTLGYSNLPEFKLNGTKARWLKHPRVAYAVACLALDVLWVIIQVALVRQHPADAPHLVGQPVFKAFSFGPVEPHLIGFMGLATALFVMTVASFNRVQGIHVQDALAWKNIDGKVPNQHKVLMQNTELVKRALSLTNVAVVTWRAPLLAAGQGSSSLSVGTTFISPGPVHEAALQVLPSHANLADFLNAIVHPDDQPVAADVLQFVQSGPAKHFTGRCRFRSLQGTWLSVKMEWVVERSGINGLPVALYGVHTDITSESDDNRTLGASRQRQQNALRMIGHDLQGSLSAVVMSAALLERYLASESNVRVAKTLDGIKLAAKKAIDYLGDAVTYARTEAADGAGEPVHVHIRSVLQELIEREAARFGVTSDKVVVHCPDDAIIESIRLFPLNAVLGNLLSNAIKYTPDPAGKVRVTVQPIASQTAQISGCTRIEVADEGVGIPSGFARQLFQAFSRADNVQHIPGTGLGLAIVANAAELLQATISIQSGPERPVGTAFTLILPNALLAANAVATDKARSQ